MHLLFVLDGVDFPMAPNLRLALRTAEQLPALGDDVDVLYLAGSSELIQPCNLSQSIIPLLCAEEAKMEEILEHGAKGGSPIMLRILKLLPHPRAAHAAFSRIILHRPLRIKRLQQKLERLCAERHYDAIVTVNAPFHSAVALTQANISPLKVLWQMDPLMSETGISADQIFPPADLIFTTRYLYNQASISNGVDHNYFSKMRLLEFPAFPTSIDNPPQVSASQAEATQVTFAGSLYKDIRTPHYALKLFSALKSETCHLTFVGGGWENYPESIKAEYLGTMGNDLEITGPVSPQQASDALQRSSILLNLGNANDDQMPSKIFEYFATCKPIVHIAKSHTDPCLPYLKEYPLSLILFEDSDDFESDVQILQHFIESNRNRRCDWQQIEEKFRSNTPAAVAEELHTNIIGLNGAGKSTS